MVNVEITKYERRRGAGRKGLVRGDRSASILGDIIDVKYTEVGMIHPYIQCKYVWRVKAFN